MTEISPEDKISIAEHDLMKALIDWYIQSWQGVKPSPPYRDVINFCHARRDDTPERQYRRLKELSSFAAMEAQARYRESQG